MVLAACSGMVAATVCHPLDVIRVQMQTGGKFKNTVDAGLSIYRNNGLKNGFFQFLTQRDRFRDICQKPPENGRAG